MSPLGLKIFDLVPKVRDLRFKIEKNLMMNLQNKQIDTIIIIWYSNFQNNYNLERYGGAVLLGGKFLLPESTAQFFILDNITYLWDIPKYLVQNLSFISITLTIFRVRV